jgi:drug/metabolite transporter (DMT)-like permease
VALGALLADEPITPEVVGGAALVLLAVYVGALRRSSSRASANR